MTTPSKILPPPRDSGFVASVLGNRATILRLSISLNVFLLLFAIIEPHLLLSHLQQRERVVVLDGAGSYTLAPLMRFQEATVLHDKFAVDALSVAFTWNPRGIAREDECARIFSARAFEKVNELFQTEKAEFSSKQFFQSINLGKRTIMKISETEVKVNLTGEFIRTGVFRGRAHVETKPFDITFVLKRNEDAMTNRTYPLVVWSFDI